MRIELAEFLRVDSNTWIAQQIPRFPVVNIHAVTIHASPQRVWEVLPSHRHLAPRWYWKALFGLRGVMGRIFRWDPGMRWHRAQPFAPGGYYAFFRIEHIEPFREVAMVVENQLTLAWMAWVLEPVAAETRLYNVTSARFKGRRGNLYWRLIRPFHDALMEDGLAWIRREAGRML